jgi:hypothetical protein
MQANIAHPPSHAISRLATAGTQDVGDVDTATRSQQRDQAIVLGQANVFENVRLWPHDVAALPERGIRDSFPQLVAYLKTACEVSEVAESAREDAQSTRTARLVPRLVHSGAFRDSYPAAGSSFTRAHFANRPHERIPRLARAAPRPVCTPRDWFAEAWQPLAREREGGREGGRERGRERESCCLLCCSMPPPLLLQNLAATAAECCCRRRPRAWAQLTRGGGRAAEHCRLGPSLGLSRRLSPSRCCRPGPSRCCRLSPSRCCRPGPSRFLTRHPWPAAAACALRGGVRAAGPPRLILRMIRVSCTRQ